MILSERTVRALHSVLIINTAGTAIICVNVLYERLQAKPGKAQVAKVQLA
jgi:hypothetical protein